MNKVIWLTGLSGSGKTTIANMLYKYLVLNHDVMLIDGDILREKSKNVDFSKDGRFANINQAISICKENEGKLVIASLISPLREMRDHVKSELGDRYIEVYVQCSISECIKRDVKGLYAKALNGEIQNFTGITQPYEEPLFPDIIVNTEFINIYGCVSLIMSKVKHI